MIMKASAWHKWFLLGSILFVTFSCTELKEENLNIEVEKYKLLTQYEGRTDYYMRNHLIDYFVWVALGAEYGQDFRISQKWHKDMNLFVTGEKHPELENELRSIVEEINSLSSDGFKISIVEDESASNFKVFFGSKNDYNFKFPGAADLVEDNHGLFRLKSVDFQITEGNLFVNTHDQQLEAQRHVLREELTQSLGLANDIDYYPNSIFYLGDSRVTKYNVLDKEVIRLLYHPNMIGGLSEESVRRILANLLGV